jgi:hypothetical protein
MVPGKSFAIMLLTGQVWQPMGRPSGFARSLWPDKKMPVAAAALAFPMKSRLVMSGMVSSDEKRSL